MWEKEKRGEENVFVTSKLHDWTIVYGWCCFKNNKESCVCVCLDVIGLSGSTHSPQTDRSLCRVWCHNLSDVHLPAGTFGQEITWPCLCECEHSCFCVFSSHALIQTALSWLKVVFGSGTVREWRRDWINNAQRFGIGSVHPDFCSCHTGHGVNGAAAASSDTLMAKTERERGREWKLSKELDFNQKVFRWVD